MTEPNPTPYELDWLIATLELQVQEPVVEPEAEHLRAVYADVLKRGTR